MIIDLKNTKVRNAFTALGILGFILMCLPLFFDNSKYQNCIDRVGIESQELCELPQYLNDGAVINPIYTKLAGVASMILGCLLIVASGGYFLTKLLKSEVSKIRNSISTDKFAKSEIKSANGKSLMEMKQLFDEELITADEFEAYKKSYLGKV